MSALGRHPWTGALAPVVTPGVVRDLLRVDCDVYSATKNTQARLLPKMAPGGTVLFDDDDLEGFGERQGADEARAARGDTPPLERVGQSAVWWLE